jgi:hypothetical protein
MAMHRSSIHDTAVRPPVTATRLKRSESEPITPPRRPALRTQITGGAPWPMRVVVALGLGNA